MHRLWLIPVTALLVVACGDGDSGIPGEGEVTAIGKIAFVSETDGNFEIYVINADGSGLTNVTNHPADEPMERLDETGFEWSPDGSRIVFTSDRDDGNPEM